MTVALTRSTGASSRTAMAAVSLQLDLPQCGVLTTELTTPESWAPWLWV